MMFGQATLREAKDLMEILNDFMSASGMGMDKDKLDIIFL